MSTERSAAIASWICAASSAAKEAPDPPSASAITTAAM